MATFPNEQAYKGSVMAGGSLGPDELLQHNSFSINKYSDGLQQNHSPIIKNRDQPSVTSLSCSISQMQQQSQAQKNLKLQDLNNK